jgi:hypothetical protein
VSYMVSSFQSGEDAGEGTPTVIVLDSGDISIWPGGRGYGPSIIVSRELWARIQRDALLAFKAADSVGPQQ